VFNKFQIFDQDLSRCLASTKDSKLTFWANTCWFKSLRVKIAFTTRMESSFMDSVWIESTWRWRSTRRLRFV